MNLKDIKQLIEMVDQSSLTEFEWSVGEAEKIVIRKQKELVASMPVMAQPAFAAAPAAASAPAAAAAPAEAAAPVENLLEIKSPMVGTFYAAPSPKDPVFVKVGDRVEVGQVVCIVEAMKLMNEIKAEVAGVVAEICIENAAPVEFGKPLFRLR